MRVSRFLILAVAVVASLPVAPSEALAGDGANAEEVLASIADRPAAVPQTMYFELVLNERVVGYAQHTLTPRGDGGRDGFDYRTETMLHLPRSARIAGRVVAKLTPSFEPIEINTFRDVLSPDGTKHRTREGVFVGADMLTTEHQVNDGAVYADTAALPERPYVSAIEFLVQRIDVRKFSAFELPELDPKRGDVLLQKFTSKLAEGGGLELIATTPGGVTDYQFTLDASGRIATIKKAPLPIVAKRCSRERRETLRRELWRE